MADYYTRRLYGPDDIVVNGPFPTQTEATKDHVAAMLKTDEALWLSKQTLLDLDTVNPTDMEQLETLLTHDPVLKAIFEMGRHWGYTQAEKHYRERGA